MDTSELGSSWSIMMYLQSKNSVSLPVHTMSLRQSVPDPGAYVFPIYTPPLNQCENASNKDHGNNKTRVNLYFVASQNLDLLDRLVNKIVP